MYSCLFASFIGFEAILASYRLLAKMASNQQKKQTASKKYTAEARYVIFISTYQF